MKKISLSLIFVATSSLFSMDQKPVSQHDIETIENRVNGFESLRWIEQDLHIPRVSPHKKKARGEIDHEEDSDQSEINKYITALTEILQEHKDGMLEIAKELILKQQKKTFLERLQEKGRTDQIRYARAVLQGKAFKISKQEAENLLEETWRSDDY